MKNNPKLHLLFHSILLIALLITAFSIPKAGVAQNLSLKPFQDGKSIKAPQAPLITDEMLRTLDDPESTRKQSPLSPSLFSLQIRPAETFGQNQASFLGGLTRAAGLPGQRSLAGMNLCFTGSASQCANQYNQVDRSMVASALELGSAQLNATLNTLTGVLPGGQNMNQYFGQYPSLGGQDLNFYGSSNQSYSDAFYSQSYSPQIQATLGYDPNSPVNFTTQFINFTSSLFSPTADWNTSFSLFPSATGFFANGRLKQDETLTGRYAAVAHQQFTNHFTDPTLFNLRKEAYAVQAGLLLKDPYYVYNSYLLNNYYAQIYSFSPNYNTLGFLADEIASWTNPPLDSAILIDRYFRRYLLNYYQTLVQYDALVYLSTHPQDQLLLTNLNTAAYQIATAIFNSPNVVSWYNDFIQRYQLAEASSSAVVDSMMNELLADYPEFLTYMELLVEVRQVTSQVDGLASVQNATDLVVATQNQQEFNSAVAQLYDAYRNQVSELLGQTRFVLEMERYYERLNGLIEQDPYYQELRQRYQLNTQEVLTYQHELALAVNNCHALYGAACNAYNDPTVIALVLSGRPDTLAFNLASFNEDYNLFWYHFYTGEGYRNLEIESQQAIEEAIVQVEPQITAARQQYQTAIDALPQMIAIREAKIAVYNDLLTLRLSDSVTTVEAALEQMAVLAASLEESDSGISISSGLSQKFKINNSYPNPFSSYTTVEFELPEAAEVRIALYDLFGRQVLTLPARKLSSGLQTIELDGSSLVSGVYVFKVYAQTASTSMVKGGRLQVQK